MPILQNLARLLSLWIITFPARAACRARSMPRILAAGTGLVRRGGDDELRNSNKTSQVGSSR